jgi:hypothetical protein
MRKKRLLAILAIGESSRGELASELGISSQSWLSKAYLSPLMVQGYIAHSFLVPDPTIPPILLGFAGSDPQFPGHTEVELQIVGLTHPLYLTLFVHTCGNCVSFFSSCIVGFNMIYYCPNLTAKENYYGKN